MANALERSIATPTLRAIWKLYRDRLRKSCFGIDRVSGKAFETSLAREIREIRHRFTKPFEPDGLLAIAKPKVSGGNRIICVPTVADRLIQFSLLVPLRDRLARMGLDNSVSYGLAPGKERSVLGARKYACRARDDHPWVYKADIHSFFDNIDRNILRTSIERVVRQPSLIPVLNSYLGAEIKDGLDRDWKKIVSDAGLKAGRGVRQGMPLSPFFAAAYLRDVDKKLARSGAPTVRYVDDIVAFFDSEAACLAFHEILKDALAAIGLDIGEIGEDPKTVIFPPGEPASFLGMEITLTGSGRYRLFVSESSMEVIRLRFADASSPAGLLARKVHLTDMGRFFASLECGYLHAYDEAENKDDLRSVVLQHSQAAQRTVLEALFGLRLETLSWQELQFVGIHRLLHPGGASI